MNVWLHAIVHSGTVVVVVNTSLLVSTTSDRQGPRFLAYRVFSKYI